MKNLLILFLCCVFSPLSFAQNASEWLAGLPQAKDYVQKRASSYDRSGGNADYRRIAPGETLVLLDERGPGEITHFWSTMWAEGPALKALILRMYWDEEATPSVESPLGDFFGLGLGDYVIYVYDDVGSVETLIAFSFDVPLCSSLIRILFLATKARSRITR